jgi:hypothetical protein
MEWVYVKMFLKKAIYERKYFSLILILIQRMFLNRRQSSWYYFKPINQYEKHLGL